MGADTALKPQLRPGAPAPGRRCWDGGERNDCGRQGFAVTGASTTGEGAGETRTDRSYRLSPKLSKNRVVLGYRNEVMIFRRLENTNNRFDDDSGGE